MQTPLPCDCLRVLRKHGFNFPHRLQGTSTLHPDRASSDESLELKILLRCHTSYPFDGNCHDFYAPSAHSNPIRAILREQ